MAKAGAYGNGAEARTEIPMKTCWIPISSDAAGKYLATPGNDYAALLSVDARASLSTMSYALTKQGFRVTYSWQSGQPTRTVTLIDRWLDGLPAPADGKVWMYYEMTFTGDMPKLIVGHIEKCFFGVVCGSADVAYIFEAREVADDTHPCGPNDTQGPQLPPPNPGPPVPELPWKPVLAGAAAGVVLTAIMVAVVR